MSKIIKKLSNVEFIMLMALLTSLLALAIDAMLPALPHIGRDLNIKNANNTQWVISAIFIGFTIGQIFYGPISDSFGRKKPIYAGLIIYAIGSIISILSWNFEIMLLGRFIQGLGAAGPKIVTMALIRDQYQGRSMARIMSFIMSLFIFVPAIAPAIGQAILLFAGWRMIFIILLMMAVICMAWFALRQPETLLPENRRSFSLKNIIAAMVETCTNKYAFGYSITMGFSFGAFIGYLNSSQQIFQNLYGVGDKFPLYFGGLALMIGCASIVNSKIVMRFGMRYLCWRALFGTTIFSLIFLIIIYFNDGKLELQYFMIWCIIVFFCMGILFGNFNALAIEKLGHIAGVASAVIGSLSTFIAITLGASIGLIYNGTLYPLIAGFTILGMTSITIMYFIDKIDAK